MSAQEQRAVAKLGPFFAGLATVERAGVGVANTLAECPQVTEQEGRFLRERA
jgi:hypothetical protein